MFAGMRDVVRGLASVLTLLLTASGVLLTASGVLLTASGVLLTASGCADPTIDPDPPRPNTAPVANADDAATGPETLVIIDVVANDEDAESDALTVVDVSAAMGVAAIADAHRVSYVPPLGFEGEATLEYTVDDGHGGQASAPITVVVQEANRPPVARDDTITTQRRQRATIDVLTNDTDPDRDILVVESVTQPDNGTATVGDSGEITYRPTGDFTGLDRFAYVITDGRLGRATAQVVVRVNTAPNANADRGGGFRRQPVGIDVLANDTDADGDALRVSMVDMPSAGTASITADNRVRYTPGFSFVRTDEFAYSISDGNGGTATASVAIGSGTPPLARPDAVTTQQGWSVEIDVLANDDDPDGDALSIVSAGPTATGTVTIVGDRIRYEPAPDYRGTARFDYQISDGTGGESTAQVSVTVNGAPAANEDRVITQIDQPLVVDVMDNDDDPDGDRLTVTNVQQPARGSATLQGDGTVRFVPEAGFRGVTRFLYTIDDRRGGTAEGQVHVWVNGAPVVTDETVLVQQGLPIDLDVLSNDSDPENNPLTVSSVTQGRDGAVSINMDGTVRYEPEAVFYGADVFTYTVADGLGGADVGQVAANVNARPIANPDNVTTVERTPVIVDLLANDTDPDNDTIAVTAVGTVTTGMLVDNGDGTVGFTADAAFFGDVNFTYEITDARGGVGEGSVTITVNGGLFGRADTALTQLGVAVDIDVLSNDEDPDNDPLEVVSVATPANGTAVVNLDDTVRYTPNGGFFGVDVFTYVVGDGRGSTATSTISVTVNAPPDAVDESVIAQRDTNLDIDVLANDSDPENATLSITAIGAPSTGTATTTPDGRIRYTPQAGFLGDATFTYTIADGAGGQDTATVSVNVNGPPEATNDTALTQRGAGINIDVLDNDTDPENDTLMVDSTNDGTSGTVSVNGDGTVRYVPNAGFFGNDTFVYTVGDGRGGSDTAQVNVAVNAPPEANDDDTVVLQDVASDIRVLDNDNEPDGEQMQFASVTRGTNGAVSVNLDNSLRYTPDPSYVGADTFTYTLRDGRGGEATATVRVSVVRQVVFDQTTTLRTGVGDAVGLAMGDIDGVLREDVVVTNRGPGTVTVVVGRSGFGAVTPVFGERMEQAVGAGPVAVAIGDIDGDGSADIVTANFDGDSISVLRNLTANGADPSFAAHVEVAAGADPNAVVLLDVNGDSSLDVVVSNESAQTISVLLNTSVGTTISFAAASTFAVGQDPVALASGDINGDDRVDIAVVNQTDDDVSVLINETQPQGTTAAFAAKVDFPVGTTPSGVAIADIDGDGPLDLVVTDTVEDDVAILINDSDGIPSFATAVRVTVGDAPVGVATGDFDGDGNPDVAVADSGGDTITLLRNTSTPGTPTFAPRITTPAGSAPRHVVVSQLNAAGNLDVLVNNPTAEMVTGRINSTAAAGQDLDFPSGGDAAVGRSTPVDAVVADFTRDGVPDVAVLDRADGTVSIFANTTAASARPITFATHATFAAGTAPSALLATDVDGDGAIDLVVLGADAGEARVLSNQVVSAGTDADFATPVAIAVGSSPQRAMTLDVDRDGDLDLVISLRGADQVAVLLNTSTSGNPSYGAPATFGTGLSPSGITVADLNADGNGDVCAANADQNSVSVLFNETAVMAAPAFATQTSVLVGARPESLLAFDYNGDSRTDLVSANHLGGSLSFLRSTIEPLDTAPSFAAAQTFNQVSGNDGFGRMTIADVNGDGRTDLLLPSLQSGQVQVVYNLTFAGAERGVFTAIGHDSGTQPSAALAADLNADGRPELVSVNAESDDLVVQAGP